MCRAPVPAAHEKGGVRFGTGPADSPFESGDIRTRVGSATPGGDLLLSSDIKTHPVATLRELPSCGCVVDGSHVGRRRRVARRWTTPRRLRPVQRPLTPKPAPPRMTTAMFCPRTQASGVASIRRPLRLPRLVALPLPVADAGPLVLGRLAFTQRDFALDAPPLPVQRRGHAGLPLGLHGHEDPRDLLGVKQ